MTTPASQTRCVVLTPPGEGSDAAAQLAARNWLTVEVHDPLLAMVEMCLRERAQLSRSSWGLQRVEQSALVIVNPSSWPGAAVLQDAVQRYLPHAAIWTFGPHGLAAASGGGSANQTNEKPATDARQRPAALHPRPARPTARAAANDASHPTDDDAARASTEDHPEVGPITRQEIDMLLESWNGEHDR